jgi:hypothetical protein
MDERGSCPGAPQKGGPQQMKGPVQVWTLTWGPPDERPSTKCELVSMKDKKYYFPTLVSCFETTIFKNIKNPIEHPYYFFRYERVNINKCMKWCFQGSPLSGAPLNEKLLE